MAKRDSYSKGKVTIQNKERFNEIEEWNLYQEEKKKIQDKYPSKPWETTPEVGKGRYKNKADEKWWNDWVEYKKEIADLLMRPNGNFDKFIFKIIPEREQLQIETWIKGRYNTETYMKTRNRNEHKNK